MIIFLGLAGSGKSTQGQLLAAHLHCPWISTGNLLREFNMDSAVQERMLRGEIIDDQTTLTVLEQELRRIDAYHNECILDGTPRTLAQAQWLVEKVKSDKLKITGLIHLNTTTQTAKARLLARHRPDDNEEAIAERFAEYENTVKPIIDYMRQEGVRIYEVDADRQPELIAADIIQKLEPSA
jgi:adenylate kinase